MLVSRRKLKGRLYLAKNNVGLLYHAKNVGRLYLAKNNVGHRKLKGNVATCL